MVKKIRTESERSVSPMNRRINKDFTRSINENTVSPLPMNRKTKTEYTRSVISKKDKRPLFSAESSQIYSPKRKRYGL